MRIVLALAASVVTVALASAAGASAAPRPPDVIRTGGPSRPADAKVAIVATTRSLSGKRFRVLDATGRAVYAGTLTRAPGTAQPWKHAAQADLTTVKTPGAYRIKVGRLQSRPWVI